MKIWIFLLGCLIVFQLGCGDDVTDGSGEADGDADGDGDADSDSDSDGDGDADSDSDGDSDGNEQGPVQIIVENNTSETKYFYMSGGVESIVSGHMSPVSGFEEESVSLFDPICMMSCGEITPDDFCAVMCDMMMASYVLAANESVTIEWDGYIRLVEEGYCADGGSCFQPFAPADGNSFTLSVNAFDGVDCSGTIDCTPDENNVIYGAFPQGESVTAEAILQIVSTDDVVIGISE